MYTKPKALIFDVFGTLVDWRGSIARQVGQTLGNRVDPDEFARAWRARYQPSMETIRTGARGFVKLDDLHRENLIEVLQTFEINDLSESQIDDLNKAWHKLDSWPDVTPGLERLKPYFFIAPCSNGNTGLMVRLCRHASLPFDTILGAEPAQAYKPDPKVYRTAAEWLDLGPHEVMMVAAHNSDLAAARDVGLQTGFFARPDEHGVGAVEDLEANDDWTIIAQDLLDLTNKLSV